MGWGGGDPWGGTENQVGAGKNSVPPQIANITPAPNTAITPQTAIGFDVTDDEGLFRRIVATNVDTKSGIAEVVHDGDTFVGRYTSSTRVPIAGGFRYSVTRNGGWQAPPQFRVYAIDHDGNEGT